VYLVGYFHSWIRMHGLIKVKQRFFFSSLTFGKSQSLIHCVFEVLSSLVKRPKRVVYNLYLALWLRKSGIYTHFPISRHVNTGTIWSPSNNVCRTITGISLLRVSLRHWHRFDLKNIMVAWRDTAVAWIKTVCDLPTPAIQIEANGAVCRTTDSIHQNQYRLVPTPRNYLHRILLSLRGRTGVVRQNRVGYLAIRKIKCEGKLNGLWVHNLYPAKRKVIIASHKNLNKLKLMVLFLSLRVGNKTSVTLKNIVPIVHH
jgi:hypothetical protein